MSIVNFNNTAELSKNTTSYPITIDDVKAYSKYFRKNNPTDTTQDTFIQQMIVRAVSDWEAETGFALLDQTLKIALYNIIYLNSNLKARITRLNVRSVEDVLYHPTTWNQSDSKVVLDQDRYTISPELGTMPQIFQLNDCTLSLYKIYNNLETNIVCGYENNDFTNLPQDIKECLIMQVSDIIDIDNDICDCQGFYGGEVQRIYKQYTIYDKSITS